MARRPKQTGETYVMRTITIFASFAVAALIITPAAAKQREGGVTQFCGDRYCPTGAASAPTAERSSRARRHATAHVRGPAGRRATVTSKSGITVSVAARAQAALQCVVNHVESAGVRIVAMRGYGSGTVAHSLHPSGNALDINQTGRAYSARSTRRAGSGSAILSSRHMYPTPRPTHAA
jgi:hypothetical protein